MKPNYILLHGSFGSPFSNWIPYLRENIEKRGHDVYTPDFPTGIGYQTFKNWSLIMESYLKSGILHENTIIYAHSIAPIFIIHFLIEHNIKVKRLILICGFNNYFGINEDYDTVNATMYCENIEQIHNLCNDIACLYSDNDPYVSYEAEKDFATKVSTTSQVYKNGGHLNSESGYTEFKDLVNYIL